VSKKQRHTETLHFDVDAGILFQLGELLVAKNSIALSELVKNAYDADATRVIIRFLDVTKEGGTIIVTDNGTGMTLDQIRERWMRIATPASERNPISSGGQEIIKAAYT